MFLPRRCVQRTRLSVARDSDRGEYHLGQFGSNTMMFAGFGPGRREVNQ